jgi:hypothetical protein
VPTNEEGTLQSPATDLDLLLKLRLVVARYGEMDGARWWNTRGQLGRFGASARDVKILAGERYVEVSLAGYFEGGIETEEQLEKALHGVREECSRWIGAGKKVIVQ